MVRLNHEVLRLRDPVIIRKETNQSGHQGFGTLITQKFCYAALRFDTLSFQRRIRFCIIVPMFYCPIGSRKNNKKRVSFWRWSNCKKHYQGRVLVNKGLQVSQ